MPLKPAGGCAFLERVSKSAELHLSNAPLGDALVVGPVDLRDYARGEQSQAYSHCPARLILPWYSIWPLWKYCTRMFCVAVLVVMESRLSLELFPSRSLARSRSSLMVSLPIRLEAEGDRVERGLGHLRRQYYALAPALTPCNQTFTYCPPRFSPGFPRMSSNKVLCGVW